MSTAKFNTWLNPDGTQNYKCRAWVNFNGTGTVAIRAAGNVTSITDNGTGNYTVNFTTAMPDANYSALITVNFNGSNTALTISGTSGNTTASSVAIFSNNSVTGTAADVITANVAILR